jgi:hypothetical protein
VAGAKMPQHFAVVNVEPAQLPRHMPQPIAQPPSATAIAITEAPGRAA